MEEHSVLSSLNKIGSIVENFDLDLVLPALRNDSDFIFLTDDLDRLIVAASLFIAKNCSSGKCCIVAWNAELLIRAKEFLKDLLKIEARIINLDYFEWFDLRILKKREVFLCNYEDFIVLWILYSEFRKRMATICFILTEDDTKDSRIGYLAGIILRILRYNQRPRLRFLCNFPLDVVWKSAYVVDEIEGKKRKLREGREEAILVQLYRASGPSINDIAQSLRALFKVSIDEVKEGLRSLGKRGLVVKKGGKYALSERGEEYVRRLIPLYGLFILIEKPIVDYLHRRGKRIRSQISDEFLAKTLEIIKEKNWITVSEVSEQFLLSKGSAYNILKKLVEKGEISETYVKTSRGRPKLLFYLSKEKLPFYFFRKCCECLFYIRPLGGICRLLSSIRRDRYAYRIPVKWRNRSKVKLHPKTMACPYFKEKIRSMPFFYFPIEKGKPLCKYCKFPLNQLPSSHRPVICPNCRTHYSLLTNGRFKPVFDGEHLYREAYCSITGRIPIIVERKLSFFTLVLWPQEIVEITSNEVIVKRGKRSLRYPLNRIRLIIDHGALTKNQRETLKKKGVKIRFFLEKPPFAYIDLRLIKKIENAYREESGIMRKMTLSNLLNVILATYSLGKRTGILEKIEENLSRQIELLRKATEISPRRIRPYEALITKEYWNAFKMAIAPTGFRFGSRKRERFVTEFLRKPHSRAKGYGGIHALINYLHRRRLLKCRRINAKEGFGWSGAPGLIHRRKVPLKEGIEIHLDLCEMPKLADREELCAYVIEGKLSYKDLSREYGRQGIAIYVPKLRAIMKLEGISILVDTKPILYRGKWLPLMEAYEKFVKNFKLSLLEEDPDIFEPLLYIVDEEGNRLAESLLRVEAVSKVIETSF